MALAQYIGDRPVVLVQSRTAPGKAYAVVLLTALVWWCPCEATGPCWHQERAEALYNEALVSEVPG